jgi:hypothetical protein
VRAALDAPADRDGRLGSRSGNDGAGRGVGSAGCGVGSTGRGSVGCGVVPRPWGEPIAATAGTRLTTYAFGCVLRHTWPARMITATSAAWRSAEHTSAPNGMRSRASAGPRRGRGRGRTAAVATAITAPAWAR